MLAAACAAAQYFLAVLIFGAAERNFDMKKCIDYLKVFIVLTALTAALSSCTGNTEAAKQEAEQAFNTVMQAFVSGDAAAVNRNCVSAGIDESSELTKIILSSLGNVTYTVRTVNAESGDRATVNADITMIDSSQVMQKYVESIVAMVSSAEYQQRLETMTRDDYQNLMDEQLRTVLSSGEIPNVTENVNVTMVKDGGEWKVEGQNLTGLLITNTLDAVSQIKQ